MAQTASKRSERYAPAENPTAPETTDPEELLSLLGDEYARAILEAIAGSPQAGRDIVDATGFSKATVYRRLDRLEEAGLVASETVFDPDGHHRERFRATFEGATCRFGPDGIETVIHPADNDR
ncbi:MarR family transcriptional regulator [Halovenus sp. WSH3]|uniref:MarR family transcriptional regulator n=1 Tax=Halovenus carboxidivorans TaxID=2692199 RepID=A0A6B0TAM7_9EURY|nr:ArsR family transcriptional regulator [Halovenus carboxidivorans]MXR52291.1 MarR family transcriptional regulator [Halovenus carboxidivorans]